MDWNKDFFFPHAKSTAAPGQVWLQGTAGHPHPLPARTSLTVREETGGWASCLRLNASACTSLAKASHVPSLSELETGSASTRLDSTELVSTATLQQMKMLTGCTIFWHGQTIHTLSGGGGGKQGPIKNVLLSVCYTCTRTFKKPWKYIQRKFNSVFSGRVDSGF